MEIKELKKLVDDKEFAEDVGLYIYKDKKLKLKQDFEKVANTPSFELDELHIGLNESVIKGRILKPHLFLALISGLHKHELVSSHIEKEIDELFLLNRKLDNCISREECIEIKKSYGRLEYSILGLLVEQMNKELVMCFNVEYIKEHPAKINKYLKDRQ